MNNEYHNTEIEENIETHLNSETEISVELEKEIETSPVDDMFQKLQSQFNNSQLILKTLQNNLKILHKEVLKERREMSKKISKNKKKIKKKNNSSGLNCPVNVSKDLSEFLGLENEETKVSRTKVTTDIIKYIKEHNLQDPENKKNIVLDEKLEKIITPYMKEGDIVQFFNLQTYLKHHYISNKKE
jgi:chromatin remodeling complex protein RSC6